MLRSDLRLRLSAHGFRGALSVVALLLGVASARSNAFCQQGNSAAQAEIVVNLEGLGDFHAPQLSPDGTKVADSDGYYVREWDIASGRATAMLEVGGVCFYGPNGRLVSMGPPDAPSVSDVATRFVVSPWAGTDAPGEAHRVWIAAHSGNCIARAEDVSTDRGTTWVVRVTTKPIGSGEGTSVTVSATHPASLAFSPDGSHLALYTDAETPAADPDMTPVRKSRPCLRAAYVWTVSADGSLTDRHRVAVDQVPVLRGRSRLPNLAVTNSGRTLFIDDNAPLSDGRSAPLAVGSLSVLQYDVATGRLVRIETPVGNGGRLTIGPHCLALAVSTERNFTVLRMADGSPLGGDGPMSSESGSSWFHGFAGSDASAFTTASAGGELSFGDEAARSFKRIGGLAAPVSQSAVFSPDSAQLALGGEDTVLLLDLRFGGSKVIHVADGGVRKIAFSPDSRKVLVGGRSTGLYSAETGALLKSWPFNSDKLAFSPDGNFFAAGSRTASVGPCVFVCSPRSGSVVRSIPLRSGICESLEWSPTQGRIAVGGSNGGITILNPATGEVMADLSPGTVSRERVGSLSFRPDGKVLAFADGSRAGLIDTNTWQEVTLSGRRPLTSNGAVYARFSQANNRLVLECTDRIAVYDAKTYQEQGSVDIPRSGRSLNLSPDGRHAIFASFVSMVLTDLDGLKFAGQIYQYHGGGYAVVTPDGRFDTNDLEDAGGLAWNVPSSPAKLLPLEAFMRQYYEPRLLPRLLSGERFLPIPSIADLDIVQPTVAISSVAPVAGGDGLVSVTVRATGNTETVRRNGADAHERSGVYDLRLFRDGQLVGYAPAGDESARPIDLTAGAEAPVEKTFIVRLPRDGRQRVTFSAYAFNGDQVKSSTERCVCAVPASLAPRKGRAYILAMGVNAYENADWDLLYAAGDARKMVDVLAPRLEATGQFDQVVTVPLISDYRAEGGKDVVTQRDATKANLKTALAILAGNDVAPEARQALPHADRLQKVQPEDLVLLAVSSHGYSDSSGRFYIIPFDIGTGPTADSIEAVKDRAVSSDELSLWLRDIDAGELVMIIDACHSAAAVDSGGFKPGPMDSRGLGQVSYDKGMRILAATQADNVALELDQIRQGLLTYALLHDGLEQERAATSADTPQITLTSWLRYGTTRVPSLYRELEGGAVPGSGAGGTNTDRAVMVFMAKPGTTADLVVPGTALRPADTVQEPALFDFNRDQQDPLIETATGAFPQPDPSMESDPALAPKQGQAPQEAGNPAASGTAPENGEIALEGVVSSVRLQAHAFTLTVETVRLPGGRTVALGHPKPKTVYLLGTAGDSSSALLSSLHPGVRVTAVGKDHGPGTPMEARAVSASR